MVSCFLLLLDPPLMVDKTVEKKVIALSLENVWDIICALHIALVLWILSMHWDIVLSLTSVFHDWSHNLRSTLKLAFCHSNQIMSSYCRDWANCFRNKYLLVNCTNRLRNSQANLVSLFSGRESSCSWTCFVTSTLLQNRKENFRHLSHLPFFKVSEVGFGKNSHPASLIRSVLF